MSDFDGREDTGEWAGDKIEELHEEIAAWKIATGLVVGGDPGDITPAQLKRLLEQHSRLEAYCRILVEVLRGARGNGIDADSDDTLHWATELQAILDGFPKDAP